MLRFNLTIRTQFLIHNYPTRLTLTVMLEESNLLQVCSTPLLDIVFSTSSLVRPLYYCNSTTTILSSLAKVVAYSFKLIPINVPLMLPPYMACKKFSLVFVAL